MHSLEHIRIRNDIASLKGTRQKLVGIQLINDDTGDISSRTFVTMKSAKDFVEAAGGDFIGKFAK